VVYITIFVILAGSVFFSCKNTPPPVQTPVFGSLTLTVGEVTTYDAQKKAWRPARLSQQVCDGDSLRTAAESRAEITWGDSSSVTVGESTTVVCAAAADSAGSTRRGLANLGGTVLATITKLAGTRENFEVRTPTAVAAVRGTCFSVVVNLELGRTDVDVLDGAVMVYDRGRTVHEEVAAGSFTVVFHNARPSRPAGMTGPRFQHLGKFLKPHHREHYFKKFNQSWDGGAFIPGQGRHGALGQRAEKLREHHRLGARKAPADAAKAGRGKDGKQDQKKQNQKNKGREK
jgi:hypothetical protein